MGGILALETADTLAPIETISIPLQFMLEMGQSNSAEELMQTMSKWVSTIVPSERCSIALLEGDDEAVQDAFVRVYKLTGNDVIGVGQPLPVASSNPGRAIMTGRPYHIPDLRRVDGFETPMLLQAGLHSCVCSPLVSGGQCYGSLNVAHPDVDHYGPGDVDRLEGLASWVATHLRIAKQVEQLSLQARTDYLTGALNRHAFTDISSRLFERWREGQSEFGVALLDLDHFKSINDNHGHAAGDAVLIGIAERIRKRLRSSDVLARLGGEEFAVLVVDARDQDILKVSECLRKAVASHPFINKGRRIEVTASIGVACPHSSDGNFDQLLSRADRFLYQAKAMGRNRVIAEQSLIAVCTA